MKIELNLSAMKSWAENEVNRYFNQLASATQHVDAEHLYKRELAARNDPALASLAAVEGMSVEAFREVVLSKPDELAERAIRRRRAILAIRRAERPDEVHAVLNELGVRRDSIR